MSIKEFLEKLSNVKNYGDVKCPKCGSTDIFPKYVWKGKEEGDEDIDFQCHECINRFPTLKKNGKFEIIERCI